jgi:hypothetical protein
MRPSCRIAHSAVSQSSTRAFPNQRYAIPVGIGRLRAFPLWFMQLTSIGGDRLWRSRVGSLGRAIAVAFQRAGLAVTIAFGLGALLPRLALAHGVAAGDKGYLQEVSGVLLIPFAYLGAKHMVTGYDHLLFLFGVIFFLYRLRDVGLYVTLFAVGHSVTLILGVLTGVSVSAFLIDAIIGLSVVYKALDNLNAFQQWFGWQPNTRVATLVFGLFHGFGLATKILDFQLAPDGLLPNLLAFNVGVETGQILALSTILIAMGYWRRTTGFARHAHGANVLLMTAGFVLTGYQLVGYAVSP